MLKKFLFLLLLTIIVQPVAAQRISLMNQTINSSGLNNLPSEVRQLQSSHDIELSKVPVSLQLESIYGKFSYFREALFSKLNSVRVTFNELENTITINNLIGANVTLQLNISYYRLTEQLKAFLSDTINSILRQSIRGDVLKNAFYMTVFEELKDNDHLKGMPSFAGSDYQTKLAKSLAWMLTKSAESELLHQIIPVIPDFNIYVLQKDNPNYAKLLASIFEKCMNTSISINRSKISESLDAAESNLTRSYLNYSHYQFVADVGIAYTDDESRIGGSLLFAYKVDPDTQLDFIAASEIPRSESSSTYLPLRSQIGFIYRSTPFSGITDVPVFRSMTDLEIDFTFSTFLGSNNFNSSNIFETGFLFSEPIGSLIMGAGYFVMFSATGKTIPPVHSLALTFKGFSPNSPVLTIGITQQAKRVISPAIEISIPFFSKK
ncbi:MAG: hypothetical protein HW421_2875 [Ignavibacteria bacterium]|nr:hypothetical protein [Ignavibacteria bacterium]